MQKIEGKSLAQGAVIGKLRFYREAEYDIDEGDYDDSDTEIARFEQAMEAVKNHKFALAEAAEANSDNTEPKLSLSFFISDLLIP